MIGIIDYGSGNIHAIANIYKGLGISARIISDPEDECGVGKLVLAGVGDFDETIRLLKNSGWFERLNQAVLKNDKPILGICVGMQIMAESSEEGKESGFCWIPGEVKKIDVTKLQTKPLLPHMGWNSICFDPGIPLFKSVSSEKGFYFLHSYQFVVRDEKHAIAHVDYGSSIVCAVAKNYIFGCQFHPEKSHENGIQLFKNFAEM